MTHKASMAPGYPGQFTMTERTPNLNLELGTLNVNT